MSFDKVGRAATEQDKVRICKISCDILVDDLKFPPEDISLTGDSDGDGRGGSNGDCQGGLNSDGDVCLGSLLSREGGSISLSAILISR